MINKIKDKKGSTLVLAIILVTIVSIVSMVLYSYVITQIKTTKKTQDSIETMYDVEGGIEKSVSEFISNINIQAPSSEVSQIELPDYIPNDSVLHRLGRYVLTLVEEVGIINGNMSHNVSGNMNARNVDSKDYWKNETIGDIINNKLVKNLNLFNDQRVWYILNENNRYIKNESNLTTCRDDLLKISDNLVIIDKALESELELNIENRKLSTEDIDQIRENIEISKNIIMYIQTIVDKKTNTNNYSDYEYFVSPTDVESENLSSVIDNIINNDLKILSTFLEKSLLYINKMPNQIENLNSIKYDKKNVWTILSSMSTKLTSSKDTLLINIENDLRKAKEANENELKLKYIVSASIKINKIIVIIGEVNADNVLNSAISNQLIAKESVSLSSVDNNSIARINVQQARRTLKGSQLICDFLQYKLSKGLLNQYSGTKIIDEVISEIKKVEINDDLITNNSTTKIYDLVSFKMDCLKSKIQSLESTKYSNNESDYVNIFDKKIKDIISTYTKDNSNVNITYRELSEIISILQEQYSRLCELNDKKYDKENYDNEVKLNESINKLKNLEVIYNHLAIENNYTTTTFNSEKNVTIKFSNKLNDTNNNTKNLYVDIDNIDVKVKIKNSDDNYYLLSSDDIDKCILSVNPSRNLEFDLDINSAINSKNRTKVDVKVYIEDISVDEGIVTYNISYDILGISGKE